MTNSTAETSPVVYARIAGFLYLIIIVTQILVATFIDPKGETINKIMANELLFRIDLVYELIMFASVVVLSWSLYVILKTVNKSLALVAMLLRFGEVIFGCLSVLSSLIVLLLITTPKVFSEAFETEQVHVLAELFLEVSHATTMSILVFFLSLGSIVFFYLFFKSQYIPRILAAFAIFAYSLTLIGMFVSIALSIEFMDAMMIFGAPVLLFEIIIGPWLMFKGINMEQWEKRALESP